MKLTELEMNMTDDAYNAEIKLDHARDVIRMVIDYFDIGSVEATDEVKFNLANNIPTLSRNLELIDDLILEAYDLVTKAQERAIEKRSSKEIA